MTTLIEMSQASYGAGNRLVAKMIEDGQVVRVPRGPRHKTVYLSPSDALIDAFVTYASAVKAHLAKTFGLRSGAETEECYFGGSCFAAHTLDYMRRLAEVSPPGIEACDAEHNLQDFMSGDAAMSYSWTMRAARLEHELGSKVERRVAYLTPPVRKGRQVTAPVGGFLLTIPAYVDPERKREVVNAIAWMASPEAMKAHVQNGFPVAPRFSVCADPEALASSPIVSFVDRMARRHELNTWSRPPIPDYVAIEAALGQEIHAAIFEGKPPKQALATAEATVAQAIRTRIETRQGRRRVPGAIS